MYRVLFSFLLFTSLSATANAQAFFEVQTGIISGYNIQCVGSVVVDHPAYELYADILAPVKQVSGAVNLTAGYMIKNKLTLSAGLIRPLDAISPVFISSNIGWNFVNTKDIEKKFKVGLYPYAGYTLYMNNLDDKEYGSTVDAGMQVQLWKLNKTESHTVYFVDYRYQYRHHVFGIGIKFSNRL